MHTRFLILIPVFAAGLLGACSPDKPWLMENTNTTTSQIQLVESRHVLKKPLSEISEADIADTAAIYKRQGAGPLYVAVAYDDSQTKGVDQDTAARTQALAEGLANNGVTQKIIVSTVQMDAPIPVAVIAFDTLAATAPTECQTGPTYDQAALANGMDGFNYKLGCGVKGAIAAQIANPADLEGHAGLSGGADAERLTNIINNDYRKGTTHAFLPSYIVSELAAKAGG